MITAVSHIGLPGLLMLAVVAVLLSAGKNWKQAAEDLAESMRQQWPEETSRSSTILLVAILVVVLVCSLISARILSS